MLPVQHVHRFETRKYLTFEEWFDELPPVSYEAAHHHYQTAREVWDNAVARTPTDDKLYMGCGQYKLSLARVRTRIVCLVD